MLPRADLNPTRPPASLEATTTVASSTDARLEVLQRLTQISIGRELQATVMSALDDGTFLVKIDEATARMSLPVGARVGDTLSMVFVSREPRPTFLLLTPQGSAPASLSVTGRLIDQLLQQQGEAKTVVARSPLMSSPSGNAGLIETALQKGMSSSGLFYESHLQDWVNGSRPLADLVAEPQAKLPLSQGAAAPQQAQTAAADLDRLAASMRELGDGANRLLDLIRTTQGQTAHAVGTDADVLAQSQAPLPSLNPEAARLVGLQLNTLEQQQMRWQGELWPGQKMEWEIGEEPGGGSQAQQQSAWSSTVRFELPHIGSVSATVRLAGERVSVQVNTPSDVTAALLRTNGGSLAGALEAAGSPLDSFLVKRDETT